MENISTKETVLVTGGTGFVGTQAIFQLLQKGYQVKTTLRSLKKKDEVIEILRSNGITNTEELKFIEADLSNDTNWDKATEGCDFVLHIASPIFLKVPKDENEMIRPAVDGTLRVLKAAKNAGVKRVVMTSNFGAVGYSHKDPTTLITEESWTNPKEKGLTAYNKSKILAERAAWNFIKTEGGTLELSVINPMAIFGPAMSPAISSGFEILKNMMDGSMKSLPNLILGIVDVRDLVDLHIRAMIHPEAKGQRFLALSGGTMSLLEIAHLLKDKMPKASAKVSTKSVPTWLVKIVGIFNEKARTIAPMLGINRKASNEKAKTMLGWQPRTNEEALLASAESLVKFKNIK